MNIDDQRKTNDKISPAKIYRLQQSIAKIAMTISPYDGEEKKKKKETRIRINTTHMQIIIFIFRCKKKKRKPSPRVAIN